MMTARLLNGPYLVRAGCQPGHFSPFHSNQCGWERKSLNLRGVLNSNACFAEGTEP